MKRSFLPGSLLGQVMLALAIGLLAAQAISAVLLYRAAAERREASLVNAVAFRMIARAEGPNRDEPRIGGERRQGEGRRGQGRQGERGWRGRAALSSSATSPVMPSETHNTGIEAALDEILLSQGVHAHLIAATIRRAGADPALGPRMQRRFEREDPDWRERKLLVVGVQREDGGLWDVGRVPVPRSDRAVLGPILLQTLVIFLVLFALMYLVLRRLTRPLHRLTERLGAFSARPGEAVMLEESGPADMRRLIAAHNAMETRITALLDEKDVMLGAIGHDLKTPLAALRVRIESVPDDGQRARMAEGIEDITATLDDILNLARVGRAADPPEKVELSALAAGVVEEFEDLDQPVTMGAMQRLARPVHQTWLKRALRNLISNAVRYGGAAVVTLSEVDGAGVLCVEDDGPGIPADQIEAMTEPFTRGEASRNRATGGAGLGLTLAKSIAEQHGGDLVLTNRPEGGLRAEIRLPPG